MQVRVEKGQPHGAVAPGVPSAIDNSSSGSQAKSE